MKVYPRIKLILLLSSFCIIPLLAPAGYQGQVMTVQDLLKLEPVPADFTISYGEDPFQFGQLRLPDSAGPHPVIILIHGGCWLAEYDLYHISPMAGELTRAGYATWSLEYRRIGNAGGGWPGTFTDVAAGADFLRDLAEKYPLDLNKTLAVGHSAGGHLALWLAARAKLPRDSILYNANPLIIKGVISLAGVGDLSRTEYQEICGQAVQKLMGGNPTDFPLRYAHGSPIEMLPLKVSQIFIQGDLDSLISVDSARDYIAAATKHGEYAELKVVKNIGHFEVIVPSSIAWPEVLKAVRSLH